MSRVAPAPLGPPVPADNAYENDNSMQSSGIESTRSDKAVVMQTAALQNLHLAAEKGWLTRPGGLLL